MGVDGWHPAGWVHGQGQADNGDVDRFHAAVLPGTRYAVEFHVLGATPAVAEDQRLAVAGWVGLEIASREVFGTLRWMNVLFDGAAVDRELVLVTPSDGQLDLTLRFNAWYGDSPLAYAFDLRPIPADDHGDSPARATSLVSGRPVQGVLDEPGDTDRFVVNTDPDEPQVVWFQAPDGATDPVRVQLSNDQGTYVDLDITRSTPFALRPGADGRVDVAVIRPWYGSEDPGPPVAYAFTQTSWIDDHGGTPESATPLLVGEQAAFAIEADGDLDLFRVDLLAGHDYRVTLEAPLEALLEGPLGTLVTPFNAWSDSGEFRRVEGTDNAYEWHAIHDGPATLMVAGFTLSDTDVLRLATAHLRVEDVTQAAPAMTSLAAGPHHWIDTWLALDPRQPGEARTLVGAVGPWETQHLLLPVQAGERYMMTMAAGAGVLAYAVLQGATPAETLDGRAVGKLNDWVSGERVFEAARSGILELQINSPSSQRSDLARSPFELCLVPMVADDHPDTQAMATSLPPATHRSAELDAVDRDCFGVDLTAGQSIVVNVLPTGVGSVNFWLVQEMNWVAGGIAWGGRASALHATAASTGRYILMLEGYGQVDVSWQTVPPDDHGDLPGDATELVPLVLTGQTTTMDDLPAW